MKKKIIEAIRAVPIAGKTYEEYVEALAEELQNSEFGIRNAELRVAREIFEEIERAFFKHYDEQITYTIKEKVKDILGGDLCDGG